MSSRHSVQLAGRSCRVCGAATARDQRHKHEVRGWKPKYDDFEGALEGYECTAEPTDKEKP